MPQMPAVFVGHGNPMNALEENRYTQAWRDIGMRFPAPKAILMISAHWMTRGTAVTAMTMPPTIHDFDGFPQALFDVRYPAAGSPALAQRVVELLAPLPVRLDQEWGLDHGAWSVLCRVYPEANIPVVQLSLDMTQAAAHHFALGEKLAALRDEGVLIMGSGNVVHNLRRLNWGMAEFGYDWATRFNLAMRSALETGDFDQIVNFASLGSDAQLSVPTPEHFYPLLYVLGAAQADDQREIIVDGLQMGAISMLSLLLHK